MPWLPGGGLALAGGGGWRQIDQLGGVPHGLPSSICESSALRVAVVELDEGPRLISNVIGIDDAERLKIDQRLCLVIEDESGCAVPRFKPA